MFFGIGGCNKTPFHTPQEYTDDEMRDFLKNFRQKSESSKQVLVTHAPPHKTKLDKIFLGLHVGSKVIREFIDNFQPDLAVCGHIHEARGVDHIGKTLIINPGPFPKHYALIEVGDNIEYELY
jgi:Icc-related predicted phosphoesterase